MLTYAGAVLSLIGPSGPGGLSRVRVDSGFGIHPGLRHLVGLFIGTNLMLLAVITGLAALILDVPSPRAMLMGLSLACLGYLAARIALAESRFKFVSLTLAATIPNGDTP
ncbi:hypothetical protein ACOI1H_11575 [Loktanella sp. DJP18]|uniref:hypothetical protein n=1 Tax=Loktanella sp. DJP18 TaxID=3409788 RepID=UPI003BB4A775